MSMIIDAVFQKGVFRPTQPVDLPENESVKLVIDTHWNKQDVLTWLKNARKTREELREKYGNFPDSSVDISEERYRDV